MAKIIKQPNGRFAGFLETLGYFEFYNMSRETAISYCKNVLDLDRAAVRTVKLAEAEEGFESYEKAMEIFERLKGKKQARGYRKVMEQPL